MKSSEILIDHEGLQRRRAFSEEKLRQISRELAASEHLNRLGGFVYAAGSYGRLEAGPISDLDAFVLETESRLSPLQKVRLLGAIAEINDRLKFPEFDGEMRFFKVYSADELIRHTGKPIDDTENSFTARMLLLLEGRPIYGDGEHAKTVNEIAENYFRDNKGKKDFRPLFLLNDILRYWRTLCLNYEDTRSDAGRKWRKKNLNLRFSRLVTVFSTVAVLLKFRPQEPVEFMPFVRMSPFERLAAALDAGGVQCRSGFRELLDSYNWFLNLKDSKGGRASAG